VTDREKFLIKGKRGFVRRMEKRNLTSEGGDLSQVERGVTGKGTAREREGKGGVKGGRRYPLGGSDRGGLSGGKKGPAESEDIGLERGGSVLRKKGREEKRKKNEKGGTWIGGSTRPYLSSEEVPQSVVKKENEGHLLWKGGRGEDVVVTKIKLAGLNKKSVHYGFRFSGRKKEEHPMGRSGRTGRGLKKGGKKLAR